MGCFEFCEDAEIEPLLAVYAGFSLDVWGQNGASFPEDKMDSVLQDILNELEYATGVFSTAYGALRASHGHPEPFKLNWYRDLANHDHAKHLQFTVVGRDSGHGQEGSVL